MALVDVAVRRGFIGGSFGRLTVTLGRVSMEGWLEDGSGFVWFEGVRREAPIDLEGMTLRFGRDELVAHDGSVAGFAVMGR